MLANKNSKFNLNLSLFEWIGLGVLIFEILILLFTAVQVVLPMITEKPRPARVIFLDTDGITAVKKIMSGKPTLTVATPSATLDSNKPVVASKSAEIINASGVSGAAKSLGDKLSKIGITTGRTGSATAVKGTTVALKDSAADSKDQIVEILNLPEEQITFDTLESTYTYDIKITLGKSN